MTCKLIKCPVCGRMHPVSNGDDLREVECTDNASSEVREVVTDNAENIYTGNVSQANPFSVKQNKYANLPLEDVEIHNPNPRNVRNW